MSVHGHSRQSSPWPDADVNAAMRGENFPVAMGVLPRRFGSQLVAAYRYARHVDDLGDESPGNRTALLHTVADDVRQLYAGRTPADPVVAGLRPVVEHSQVPIDLWLRLVDANLVDQRITRYETFDDLLDYCRLSATPVGEIVLHIFGCSDAMRVELSDRICIALQLLEHWQDVREDHSKGRIYLPHTDLRRFDVAEEQLAGPAATTQLRALIGFETDRALAWLNAGAVLVSTLRGWPRLAISGYVAGGRAAAAALRRSGHDPMVVPKATRLQVASAWLEATVRWPG